MNTLFQGFNKNPLQTDNKELKTQNFREMTDKDKTPLLEESKGANQEEIKGSAEVAEVRKEPRGKTCSEHVKSFFSVKSSAVINGLPP